MPSILRELDASLLAAHGMTARDYEVLLYLAQSPERRLPMSSLSERTMLTRSGITRLVDGLVSAGLIERASCQSDARISYAELTDAGYEKLRDAGCTHVASIRHLFLERYSAEEIETLAALLADCRAHIRATAPFHSQRLIRRQGKELIRARRSPRPVVCVACFRDRNRLHLRTRQLSLSTQYLTRQALSATMVVSSTIYFVSRSPMSATATVLTAIPAGVYNVDPSHSNVGFEVRHMGIATVRGAFKKFEGTVDATGETPRLSGSVEVASIDTGDENRDGHLQSPRVLRRRAQPPDHLPYDRHAGGRRRPAKLIGEITIKGITKPIELTGTLAEDGEDPWGNERVGFEVTGVIDRREFDLKWNQTLPNGNLLVANNVKLVVSVSAVKGS